jgi:hypothetical protein
MTKTGNAGDPLDTTIDRVRSEYREMPGLRLTFDQMQRLWLLDRPTCRALVERLLDAQFLRPTRDGRYVRSDMRRSPRRRPHEEA